jgi:hypothetical protein
VDEQSESFPFSAIVEARLHYEWDELASRLHDARR